MNRWEDPQEVIPFRRARRLDCVRDGLLPQIRTGSTVAGTLGWVPDPRRKPPKEPPAFADSNSPNFSISRALFHSYYPGKTIKQTMKVFPSPPPPPFRTISSTNS
ncbi:unnamed protein product [Linum trigynum]|uniref:Uncharacterized protein n=1 Tax=Linum trigynum TaxID=586398 RepID=A0AAV2D6I0_9ROSI